MHRAGGMTGDTCGTSAELAEMAVPVAPAPQELQASLPAIRTIATHRHCHYSFPTSGARSAIHRPWE
jgi:hypothetical protein